MADFDPTKPVQTRYGSPARIICTDRKGGPPLLALVRGQEREERIFSFYPSGQVYTTHCSGLDLVNVPERESLFYNTYCDGGGTRWYATPEEARAGLAAYERWASAANAPNAYLGTIEIVREGGEGGVIVDRKLHNLLENNNG